MKKAMRTALLALLAALCLGLSGCENEDECIRQALIDMGYMSPTPEPNETREPSETPEASETPDVSDMPASSEEPGGTLPTPNVPTPDVPTPNLPTPDLPTTNLPDPAEVLTSLADHLPTPYQDNPSAALPDIPDAADNVPTP